MASNQTKGLWRSRIERLLATDMSVAEWCAANKVSESATYVWLGRFADADPELFGGEQNIADRNQSKWVTRTRDNMRASSAPIVPAGKDGADAGFVRIDVAELAYSGAGADPVPRHTDPITVSIGPATVSVPANSALADVACVLQAVSAL